MQVTCCEAALWCVGRASTSRPSTYFTRGASKYDDGESYVDENEVTLVAFHVPQYDFDALSVWPRKYLLRPGEPIPGDDDTVDPSSDVAADAPTTGATTTSSDSVTVAKSQEFDEGKESYLEYKARLRREKKRAAQAAAGDTKPVEGGKELPKGEAKEISTTSAAKTSSEEEASETKVQAKTAEPEKKGETEGNTTKNEKFANETSLERLERLQKEREDAAKNEEYSENEAASNPIEQDPELAKELEGTDDL